MAGGRRPVFISPFETVITSPVIAERLRQEKRWRLCVPICQHLLTTRARAVSFVLIYFIFNPAASVCVCVCVCVRACVCVCAYVRACVRACVQENKYRRRRVCIRSGKQLLTMHSFYEGKTNVKCLCCFTLQKQTHTHSHTHAHTRTHIYTHTYTHQSLEHTRTATDSTLTVFFKQQYISLTPPFCVLCQEMSSLCPS